LTPQQKSALPSPRASSTIWGAHNSVKILQNFRVEILQGFAGFKLNSAKERLLPEKKTLARQYYLLKSFLNARRKFT
jgi:hypothetical protein